MMAWGELEGEPVAAVAAVGLVLGIVKGEPVAAVGILGIAEGKPLAAVGMILGVAEGAPVAVVGMTGGGLRRRGGGRGAGERHETALAVVGAAPGAGVW